MCSCAMNDCVFVIAGMEFCFAHWLTRNLFGFLFFLHRIYCCVLKQEWQVSVEHIAIAQGVDNKTIGSNGVMQVGTD